MAPLVSVIVATYRREYSLMQALKSLAAQTFRDFEILLVDDNDAPLWNEKVQAIARNFTEVNPDLFLTYLENHPNQGSAKTRNRGITEANGEYITFLDDDDLYLPEKIEHQVSFMQKNHCDYCITDLDLYNEKDQLIDRRIRSYIRHTAQEYLQRYHLLYHMTGTDTMMFRKDYLMQIGCFAPIDVGDEYYLMQRAIECGGKFGYLPGCNVKAYIHNDNGGLSSGEGKINGENALYAYKKQYFDCLSPKDHRYIKMRHFAVIAFTELRRGNFLLFFKNAALAFMISPGGCFSLLRNRGNI